MAMLMRLCGIVLAAIGLALGVMSIYSPGEMQIHGLTSEAAAILLVGGILSLGLSGLQSAGAMDATTGDPLLMRQAASRRDVPADFSLGKAAGVVAATTTAAETVVQSRSETVSETLSGAKSSVSETIEALEQAKSDIKAALGGSESFDSPSEPPVAEAAAAAIEVIQPSPAPAVTNVPETRAKTELPASIDERPVVKEAVTAESPAEPEATADTGLFVVEEQTVRGKPARILSDGTVEAETEEGWMRFENLEHLNEYLDSLASS